MIGDLIRNLNPAQSLALLMAVSGVGLILILSIAGMVTGTMNRMAAVRARSSLTAQMIDRGMSADEIARVLELQGHDLPTHATPLAFACEAVVRNDDDEWVPSLILQAAEGRYYVHYVGEDMDENAWVTEDRVRFPAGSTLPEVLAATLRNRPERNGMPGKPPVELEV